MANARRTNRHMRDPGSRVSILLNEPLNSTVRAFAARKNRQIAPLLREWIEERIAQEMPSDGFGENL